MYQATLFHVEVSPELNVVDVFHVTNDSIHSAFMSIVQHADEIKPVIERTFEGTSLVSDIKKIESVDWSTPPGCHGSRRVFYAPIDGGGWWEIGVRPMPQA